MNHGSITANVSMSLPVIGRRSNRHVDAPWIERSPLLWFSGSGLAVLLAFSLMPVPRAWSQQQARLSGIVSDPSGGVIPTAINDYGTSFNSGSGGEDRNGYYLDGVDIETHFINGSYVPSIDAIQEFKIETSPYAADLGTTPSAQILLVTKGGTNQLHGDAYEFLRNSFLDAYNYFDNCSLPVPELRKNRFGGTIGGPIIKDRRYVYEYDIYCMAIHRI